MPTLVVNDPSYGEGLSSLMGGFVSDPKRRAEAMALQARIDAQNIAARQILRAATNGTRNAYIPWKWRPIMAVIRGIPSSLFQKMNV